VYVILESFQGIPASMDVYLKEADADKHYIDWVNKHYNEDFDNLDDAIDYMRDDDDIDSGIHYFVDDVIE